MIAAGPKRAGALPGRAGVGEAVQGCAVSSPMEPTELRAILDRLGWSQGELARRMNRDKHRTYKMCRGRAPIDQETATWLRRLDAVRATISDEAWAALRDVLGDRPREAEPLPADEPGSLPADARAALNELLGDHEL